MLTITIISLQLTQGSQCLSLDFPMTLFKDISKHCFHPKINKPMQIGKSQRNIFDRQSTKNSNKLISFLKCDLWKYPSAGKNSNMKLFLKLRSKGIFIPHLSQIVPSQISFFCCLTSLLLSESKMFSKILMIRLSWNSVLIILISHKRLEKIILSKPVTFFFSYHYN